MSDSIWPFLGYGVGLRAEHFPDLLEGPPLVDWFEALTENHLDSGGRPLFVLEQVRREVPVALHGVSLSIGSADPLDRTYLKRLADFVRRLEPSLVTDHLCWTGIDGRPLYDLLPLPYTEEVLEHVVRRIAFVQDALGRRICLENPSTYVAFEASTLPEWEFLAEVARRADCGILLDVNNVYVSAHNLGFDAERYLDALPRDRIAQIHLAGFSDLGTYLFDTHSAPVHEDVWALYRHAIRRFGPVSTLVEWDSELPTYGRLCAEAARAEREATRTENTDAADVESGGDLAGRWAVVAP